MARMANVRITTVTVSVLILSLLSTSGIRSDDPPSESSPTVVPASEIPPREPNPEYKELMVPCEAGSHTFEVSPVTTKVRVLIENFMRCMCFPTAEAAAAWMQSYKEELIREKTYGSFDPAGSGVDTVRTLAPGEQVEVNMFCYTVDQIMEYGRLMVAEPEESSGR